AGRATTVRPSTVPQPRQRAPSEAICRGGGMAPTMTTTRWRGPLSACTGRRSLSGSSTRARTIDAYSTVKNERKQSLYDNCLSGEAGLFGEVGGGNIAPIRKMGERVFGWRKARRESGWMVIGAGNGELTAVLGDAGAGRPAVRQYAVRAVEETASGLHHAARDLGAGRYQCATLLAPDEYQIVVVDAPNVPRDELKTAIRWRVKDLIDAHIDDVTLDILDIPVPKDTPARNHTMYAVAGRNDAIQAVIKRFEDADIPLTVIDIPETAQRNIAALYEEPERAVALLHFDEHEGLLTINYAGELYFARRFDFPYAQLNADDE